MSISTRLAEAPLGRLLIERRDATRHRRHRGIATQAVAALMALSTPEPPVRLSDVRVVPTANDVVIVRGSDGGRSVLAKFALTPRADRGLARHLAMLDVLAQRGIPVAVPQVVRAGALVLGRHGLRRYVVETALPGASLPVVPHPATVAAVLDLAGRMHRGTAAPVLLGEAEVSMLIDPSCDALAAVAQPQWAPDAVTTLRAALAASLGGRTLRLGVTHGDLWPGNVLGHELADGSWCATGLVDWENGSLQGVPEVDVAHHLLSLHPSGPAAAVVQAIGAPRRTMAQLVAPYGAEVVNPELPASMCTVLAWLAHVGGGIERAHHSGPGRAWLGSVVAPVLQLLTADDCGWRHAVAQWASGGR